MPGACRQDIAPAALLRATMAPRSKCLALGSKSCAAAAATNRRAAARRSFSQAPKDRRSALPPHLPRLPPELSPILALLRTLSCATTAEANIGDLMIRTLLSLAAIGVIASSPVVVAAAREWFRWGIRKCTRSIRNRARPVVYR